MNKTFPWLAIFGMAIIVAASNYLVQIPINDWLTWGALTYPLAFLVNDLANRFHGAATARKIIYIGFPLGVLLSLAIGSIGFSIDLSSEAPSLFAQLLDDNNVGTRIALASGTAFLLAQLLDVSIFNRLRDAKWWIAPSTSSAISMVVDTVLFFGLAFAGTGLPWVQWAAGDLGVKWSVAILSVLVYGLVARKHFAPQTQH